MLRSLMHQGNLIAERQSSQNIQMHYITEQFLLTLNFPPAKSFLYLIILRKTAINSIKFNINLINFIMQNIQL